MMTIEPPFLEIEPVQGRGLSKYFKLRETAKVAFRQTKQKRREESWRISNIKEKHIVTREESYVLENPQI